MPEHQQVQQSTESKSNAQKQVTTASPTQASNPYFIIQRAKINPKSLTHADIMQLQRTIGNRAVGMLLSSIGNTSTVQQATVQRQEIPEEEEPLQGKMAETVQRQDVPDEDEPLQSKFAEPIQRQEIPEPEEEEPPLQGKFENNPEQETCPSCSTLPIQREIENRTGMPDNLKAGVESLSGIDMGDVRVHYNSSKPADVGALAYTQGTDIHVAPGQERHVPHEAWHVVQQAQGRVKPTMQLKDGVPVNDDEGLEHEADVMGSKSAHGFTYSITSRSNLKATNLNVNSLLQKAVIQRSWDVAMIRAERDRLANADKTFGGSIALHHIISRDQITNMIRVIREITGLKGKDAKKWAETIVNATMFLKTVTDAASESFGEQYREFKKQTEGNPETILHNLPVNLVAGPEHPLGDKGTKFDPATVPSKMSGNGVDERVPDERSVYLGNMLSAFENFEKAYAEGKNPEAANFLQIMVTELMKAVKSLQHPASIPDIDPDQWFKHDGRWAKKHIGTYRTSAKGVELFRTARLGVGKIPDESIEVPKGESEKIGKEKSFRLIVSKEQIRHIFERHSYAHFKFDDIKLRNTFWPAEMNEKGILTDIKDKAKQIHDSLLVKYAKMDQYDFLGEEVNLQLPGMFLIATTEAERKVEVDPQGNQKEEDYMVDDLGKYMNLKVVVDSIAPEGGDQYTAEELSNIRGKLNPPGRQ